MKEINILGINLQLLPEKAIYIEELKSLLVSDVHLGKSETFQAQGVPISSQTNVKTLDRLQQLCSQFQPESLFVLGDLFHSRFALVDEVLRGWFAFLEAIQADVRLILGNHDRHLFQTLERLGIQCSTEAFQIDHLLLSHEPSPQTSCLNVCGHVHPCVRIKTKLDNLRLPCFYLENLQNLLILPSFGEFTGGYEVSLKPNTTAFVVVDDSVISFEG